VCAQQVAPYPSGADVYRARSPLFQAASLRRPVILFQGTDDKVVPPAQAEAMIAPLRKAGVTCAYVLFEGEGHGWRQAKNIRTALESELYFYSRRFGFEPADTIDNPPKIDNEPYKVRRAEPSRAEPEYSRRLPLCPIGLTLRCPVPRVGARAPRCVCIVQYADELRTGLMVTAAFAFIGTALFVLSRDKK
jgi:hypothetical protein